VPLGWSSGGVLGGVGYKHGAPLELGWAGERVAGI